MGRPDGVRVMTATGIPDGCDVVDVDAEAKRRSFHRSVLAQGSASFLASRDLNPGEINPKFI
jgi:hypothetical protein